MANNGISMEGMNDVMELLDGVAGGSFPADGIKKACALVERAAKQKAPKGVGELRRSITSKVEEQDGQVVGVVYTPLEYAPYVEFGTGLFAEKGGRKDVPWNYQDDKGEWHTTSGMKPQPFLRPALQENREEIVRLIKGG